MSPVYGDDDAWLQQRIEMREERRRPAREPRKPLPVRGILAVSVVALLLVSYALIWTAP